MQRCIPLLKALFFSFILLTNLYSQNGLRLVGHLDQKHGTTSGVSYNGSWGYVAPDGREYALLGTATGTAIIDITDTLNIYEVVHIPGPTSLWREMRTYKDRMYVVTEAGGGTQIVDLSQLPDTATLIKSFTYTAGTKNTGRSHSLQIFDGYLYLNGCALWGTQAQRGAVIFSLADPDNPQFVGEYSPNYFHDSYVRNDTIFGASIYGSGGIYIADIKNKSAPVQIGKISYTGSGTHNVWTTKDGKYVISTDEIGTTEKSLKFWDLQNLPTIPGSASATYLFNGLGDIEHNVFVRGDYAYTAWYTAGTVVVDVKDPLNPATAGWYDSSVDSLYAPGNYDGVWGMYPYYWSGKITSGDMQNGLYVFVFDSLAPRTPTSLLTPPDLDTLCDNSQITFRWTQVADPVKDPHTYWLAINGPGADTTYKLGSDTTFAYDPSSLPPGVFEWYVITKDEANQISSADTFYFVRPDKSPFVATPNGGDSLNIGTVREITWNVSNCVDSVEISYTTNNGSSWIIIENSAPAAPASYNWTIPATPTTQGKIRLRDVADPGFADVSDAVFTIYDSLQVTLISPNGGEVWKSGTMKTISWSSLIITDVSIDYSVDNGANWIPIVVDTPAVLGSVQWLIPNLSTTIARVRITDVANNSTTDQSDNVFTIAPQTIDMAAAWNLVSIPVIPTDSSLATNFPGAAVPVYRYLNGYVGQSAVSNGAGYWVRYDNAQTIAMSGSLIAEDTIEVTERWNIVGSVSYPVPVSSIGAVPGSMTLSTIWGYDADSGYYAADSIMPGHGYWVKVSEAGQLVLSSSPANTPAAVHSSPAPEHTGMLTFIDAKGRRQTLYITDGALNNAEEYELPPSPPKGMFDIRFATQRNIGEVHGNDAVILLQGLTYPVTVLFEQEANAKGVYSLIERKGEKEIARYDLSTQSVTMPSNTTGSVMLEVNSNTTAPKEFTLYQNHPNPFNPLTVISYQLPADGMVTLKIYTPLGQEIATLVDEVQSAGSKLVEWNAGNFPSGIYFYKLTAGKSTEVKKMVLAK